MLQKLFLVSTEESNKYVGNFTVGFAVLKIADNVEEVVNVGTGTLVTVGSVHGILTAAHVLDALPKRSTVGLILNADGPLQFRRAVINMDHIEPPVIFRAEKFGADGPDLAFLKLTDEARSWLHAKCSFYNLSKRRDDVLAGRHPVPGYSDSIVGIIDELTKPLPGSRPGVRAVKFTLIYCGVRMSAVKYPKNHNLNYFQIETAHEPKFPVPKSFQGTSGGAVWRIYVTKAGDKMEVVDRRLIAVPFYEGISSAGKPEITCHDAKDIYGSLIDKITERWPKETSQ